MVDRRAKTLSYRRAEWLDGISPENTLEAYLKEAHNILKTVDDRTIVRDSGQCIRSVNKLSKRDGGIFIHLAADTPGEEASVVPKNRSKEAIEISTAAAPVDAEFMDADAFLYVNGNDVCMCSTGMRDGAIRLFMYEFFIKAKLGKHATKFDLLRVPNIDKMKMLSKEGVKKIDLRASLYQATTHYEKRKQTASGSLRTLAKHLLGVVHSEKPSFDDGLRVSIIIKTDERVLNKQLAVGEHSIELLAKDVLSNFEEDDDFIIETGTGQKIRADEIMLRDDVYIDSYGKSVKYRKAWDSLESFYNRLKNSGALSQ